MNEKKIQIGIVGVGFWSTVAHIPRLSARKDVKIVAACSRNSKRLKSVKKIFEIPYIFTSIEDMLAKGVCQAVVICTPNFLHASQSILSLKHGASVLTEKPLALNFTEAKQVFKETKRSKNIMRVSFDRRFWPNIFGLKDLIRKGMLGKITYIRIIHKSHRTNWAYLGDSPPDWIRRLTNWTRNDGRNFRSILEQSGGGVIIEIGSHLVDQLLWLTDSSVISISCTVEPQNSIIETAAHIFVHLDYGIDAELIIDADWRGKPKVETFVSGSLNVAISTDQNHLKFNKTELYKIKKPPYRSTSDEFIEAIKRNSSSGGCTCIEAMNVVKIIDACYRSSKFSQLVDLA